MSNLTKEEKITYIKSQNIQYIESSQVDINTLYQLALVKELISARLEPNEIDCFGSIDPVDSTCKSCYLNKNGSCNKFKDYLQLCKDFPTLDTSFKVKLECVGKEAGFSMEDSVLYLKKLGVRESSCAFKIAKSILESNNCSFGQMLETIQNICGEGTTLTYAKSRFYQIRRIIQEKTDIRIGIFTQKFVHLSKKPEEPPKVG